MKKWPNFSATKVLISTGVGLLITLGAFWHYRVNQSHLDRMNTLTQGVGTCYNRISQTFMAMMIKDLQSPYLNKGFMTLSDECFSQVLETFSPFKKNLDQGFKHIKQLMGEVLWFHEKIGKTLAPTADTKDREEAVATLSSRYTKMEELKVTFLDEVDATRATLKEMELNSQIIMGAGLLIFVIGLSLLSLQEVQRRQERRKLEAEGLGLLKSGMTNMGSMVDSLIERALQSQHMPVLAQIFKDYHGEVLEKLAQRVGTDTVQESKHLVAQEEAVVPEVRLPKTSLKEVLVTLQNVHSKETLQLSDIRDVQLEHEFESCEHMMNAALNILKEKNLGSKKVVISNQIHSDRSVVNFFVPGNTFNAEELEFASQEDAKVTAGIGPNLMILKEMVAEAHASWFLENKADRQGKVTGLAIRLVLKRLQKEKQKNLVSVIRGRKKDLVRGFTEHN